MVGNINVALDKFVGKPVCCKMFGTVNLLKHFDCFEYWEEFDEIVLCSMDDEDLMSFKPNECTVDSVEDEITIHIPNDINIMIYTY